MIVRKLWQEIESRNLSAKLSPDQRTAVDAALERCSKSASAKTAKRQSYSRSTESLDRVLLRQQAASAASANF